MCIPGGGDSRAKAWKCGDWCVSGRMAPWIRGKVKGWWEESLQRQVVVRLSRASIECQAKDSGCVMVRAGFSERSPAVVFQGRQVPQADGRGWYRWR